MKNLQISGGQFLGPPLPFNYCASIEEKMQREIHKNKGKGERGLLKRSIR